MSRLSKGYGRSLCWNPGEYCGVLQQGHVAGCGDSRQSTEYPYLKNTLQLADERQVVSAAKMWAAKCDDR
ncbi:MAG: hypothetical protein OJF51_002676 [Nitrospira sp.]|jgi:hypothetical protein|nr:MAG: hypothetical protein OJF51_002676 [Nitrospira sp.]